MDIKHGRTLLREPFTDCFYEVAGVPMNARIPGHLSEERAKMALAANRQRDANKQQNGFRVVQ